MPYCLAVAENDALNAELQKKTYVASNQRVSGVDAQRINRELKELKTQLNQANNELADLDRELNAEEQLYSQEKMSVSFYSRFVSLSLRCSCIFLFLWLSSCTVIFCLSVTRQYCTKVAERRMTEAVPHNRPGTLVVICKRSL